MRRVLLATLTALVLLLGLTASPGASASTGDVQPGLEYVAMGDSFSSAAGVLPLDLTSPLVCQRSLANYPRLIAAATGAALTDVTCGGATTGNFETSQYPGVPPQRESLGPTTRLVTMTIGLNDSLLFLRLQAACGSAGVATLGVGSPCQDRYGTSFAHTINTTTYPALVNALRAVRERAPQARIAILGIPWILPATGGCFPVMPVARGDVAYLRTIQATLNDAIRRAANATGAVYVDFSDASEGHDACQRPGVRWIEPVLFGTNPIIVHPNALGEAAMAEHTLGVLGLR